VNQSDINQAALFSFYAACCDDNSSVTQLCTYETQIRTRALTHRHC